jgi:agmatine/peptidylarginine deiminase
MLFAAAALAAVPCGRVHAQPGPPIRMCAEWEPSYGTLIRWPLGIPPDLVVELAEDDSLYVLVESGTQQEQAADAFESWGVRMDHCRFITAQTWSHWTRDWGPHSMFDEQGVWGIIDPVFEGYPWIPGGPYRDYTEERGYEEDDQVNAVLAQQLSCPLHPFPAYLTGGNFMTDGHGCGFSSRAMLTENEAFWSHAEFLALAESDLGISDYFITENAEEYGIQHIDCVAKMLDEQTILVKQVPSWHPEYDRIETVCDQLTTAISCYGTPYRIFRVQCDPYSGNDVAAYTNSYILNTKVLVPLFGLQSDAAALQTYEEAMPGYEVIGFQWGSWYYYDALHCRTREIMDRFMLLLWHGRVEDAVPASTDIPIRVMAYAYSGAGLVADSLKVVWRLDAGPWQVAPLLQTGPDSLEGVIPGQPPGSAIDYYVVAADLSGRRETLPRSAPLGFYSFQVAQTGLEPGGAGNGAALSVELVPAYSYATLQIGVAEATELGLQIYDTSGRLVWEQAPALHQQGTYSVQTRDLGPGVYFVRMQAGEFTASDRFVILR